MFKVNVRDSGDVEGDKERVMEKMNDYLESNEGRLINIQLVKNKELVVYFVMSNSSTGGGVSRVNSWEFDVRNMLHDFQLESSVMEFKPL